MIFVSVEEVRNETITSFDDATWISSSQVRLAQYTRMGVPHLQIGEIYQTPGCLRYEFFPRFRHVCLVAIGLVISTSKDPSKLMILSKYPGSPLDNTNMVNWGIVHLRLWARQVFWSFLSLKSSKSWGCSSVPPHWTLDTTHDHHKRVRERWKELWNQWEKVLNS